MTPASMDPASAALEPRASPDERAQRSPAVERGVADVSRVLMIDNNDGDINLVAIACAECGERIHWERAQDGVVGRLALERIRDGIDPPCDLVILDLNMPRMGGLEVLSWLRAQPSFADLPVVVLTTSQAPGDHERCLARGADDVLIKPMTYDAYLALIARLRPYLRELG